MSARKLVTAFAAVLGVVCTATVNAGDVPRATAQHLLDEIRAMNRVPGMASAVRVGDETLWTGASGWADVAARRPVEDTTSFRLASVSKLYAATLALRLFERERLDIDSDLRSIVDGLPRHLQGVTARHLAAHNAGLAHYRGSDRGLGKKHYATLTEVVPIYADRALLFPPGEGYEYSSWGYSLLGAAIERASRAPFSVALHEEILAQFDFDESYLEDTRPLPPGATTLYARQSNGSFKATAPDDQSFANGATGLRATARDVVRFGTRYAAGRILSPATRDLSWTPMRMNDGSDVQTRRYRVGFGWRIAEDWNGRRVVHHSGATLGARSVLLVYPQQHAAVTVLSNAAWSSRIETTAEMLAAPFLASSGHDAPCPQGRWSYRGSFRLDDDADARASVASGALTIDDEDDLCAGRIEPEAALGEWLAQREVGVTHLAIARVVAGADSSVFALVHPWGLAPLQVSVDENGRLVATGDIAGRPLRLTGSARQ